VPRLDEGKRARNRRLKVRADSFLDPLCRSFFMNHRHIVASALASALAMGLATPLDRVALRTVYNDAATIYTQSAKLAAPVLLRATQGSGDAAERPMIEMVSDPTLGWQRHMQGRIDCVDVAGRHATILQQPHVEEVARAMQRHLDRMGSRRAQPVAA
jgi:thioesterase domain-containing protein